MSPYCEEEHRRDCSRPERVVVRHVEPPIERLQPAGGAGNPKRIGEADVVRQPDDQPDERRDKAKHDQIHLFDIGPRDRLHAAEHRINGRRHAHQKTRRGDVHAHDDRQHHCRRRNDGAARHRARDQKQERRQAARLRIESPLEILVRREHTRVVKKRHERHRKDQHREREAVIELYEAHPIDVALASRPNHRDGRKLCRHHRQTDCPPGNAPAREKVALEPFRLTRLAQTVQDDPHQVRDEDDPIDPVHDTTDG